jgi:hypothetical protein
MSPEEEAAARRRANEVNANQNNQRVSRIEEIARRADGARSGDLDDTDGETSTGRFQGGEFDDSPEARERAAEAADREAEEAIAEEREAAARAISDEESRARELQSEGVEVSDDSDEKVVDGVRYFLTIVNGEQRWLTKAQLREKAQKVSATEVALQRAQDAVQRATQLALAPREAPSEVSEQELEDIITSANLGDSDAVKKLASVLKGRSSTNPVDISRQVSQQLATQRAIDQAEREQAEILRHASLGRVFKMRLGELSRDEPDLQIVDAYRRIGQEIREEFSPMLRGSAPEKLSKDDRKRLMAAPPRAASRATRVDADDDEEESPSAVADRMAKARGQARAVRHGRNPG